MNDTSTPAVGWFAKTCRVADALYTGVKRFLFVLILLAVYGMVQLAGSGDGGSVPPGWHQVHSGTTMTAEAALGAAADGKVASDGKVVAVIRFNGDTSGPARKLLADQVDELIVNKDLIHEAVVVVSSPGGGVSEYGQIFSEFERLRENKVPLTVAIDTIAASGGYMMSLPANNIVAAPTAMVGSVGVVTEFPNFHRFLKEHGVDFVTVTAGVDKRSGLSPISEVTPEAIRKTQDELAAVHEVFLAMVKKYRPRPDMNAIQTANHWMAAETVEKNLGLVDELGTSAGYLLKLRKTHAVVTFQGYSKPTSMLNALGASVIDRAVDRFVEHIYTPMR